MLRNLKAEMVRANVKADDLAALIGVKRKTIDNKIAQRSDFSFAEAVSIRDAYFPDAQLEYLFTPTT